MLRMTNLFSTLRKYATPGGILLLFTIFYSCSSGAGGGGGSMAYYHPPVRVFYGKLTSATNNFLTFDLSSFNSNTIQISGTLDSGASDPRLAVSGAWDPINQWISGMTPQILYYTNNGKLNKISAKTKDPLSPTQVSNETNALDCASPYVYPDYANFNDSVLIFNTGICSNSMVSKMVKIGSDSTVSPTPLPTNIGPIFPIYSSSTGAISEWLVKDFQNSNILRCNLFFTSCSVVFSNFSNTGIFFVAAYNPFTEYMILNINNLLIAYNIHLQVLSPVIYSIQFPTQIAFGSDGVFIYFADGGNLFKIPLNASNPTDVITLAQETSGQITDVQLTENSVIYKVQLTISQFLIIKGVSKTSGLGPASLVQATIPLSTLNIDATAGSWVYYSEYSSGSLLQTGSINEDGSSGLLANKNSIFSGGTVPPFFTPSLFFQSIALQALSNRSLPIIIRAEGCSNNAQGFISCAGATLKSFNAATNSILFTLGTIPSDIGALWFYGIGNEAVGSGTRFQNGFPADSDILFANTSIAGSFTRITNSSDNNFFFYR